MEPKALVFLLLTISSFFFTLSIGGPTSYRGSWKVLKRSIGVSAMHMALLPNDRIITYDWTNSGPSNITFPNETCKKSYPNPPADCYAHSVEFDPTNRNVRPLRIISDTWCSSGSLSPEGVLIQTGGFQLGERVVRYFKPCEGCDWVEDQNGLLRPRWYASNQILPNGKIIVVGGRAQFSYEFIPKSSGRDRTLYQLPFLEETRDSEYIENNLYPFLHLSPDGNLFIFANDRAILLDYVNNKVVRKYPVMLGGVSRNYPSTGSSALLPLKLSNNLNNIPDAEVFICGGTQGNSNEKANVGTFLPVSNTCGRLVITAANPKWEMEEMPIRRIMGDMILLPTGDVLIINGASKGTAGWYCATDPVLYPVLYKSNSPKDRFEVMAPTTTPRLYHSTAHLLSDGRVIVGGSNPNSNYNFSAVFPTELSIEAFSPPYLSSTAFRATITMVKPGPNLAYKQSFSIGFQLKATDKLGNTYVTLVAPSFTTHSNSMNQRVLVLAVNKGRLISPGNYAIDTAAPATTALAPPGYYQLFVVHEGVPSRGKWVHIK